LRYPENFESKIGFDQVKAKVSNYCETSIGRQQVDEIKILTEKTMIEVLLSELDELRQIMDNEKSFVLEGGEDLSGSLARARVEGTYLDLQDFINIRKNLKSIKQLQSFFSKSREDLYANLKNLLKGVNVYPFIQDRLDQVFNRQGQIRDNASPELLQIRRSIYQKQSGISKRMEKIIGMARKEGWIDQDVNAAVRDGRLVIPLPATHKRKISGLIHDESATGKTAFVEPVELVEVNNEIRELQLAEKREIIKILVELTSSIRPYFNDIIDWTSKLGYFDFIRAKTRVCRDWQGMRVRITEGPEIDWKGARHPLLSLSYPSLGKKVVPQDIKLTSENRMLLISGPNAGGKSIALKSTGLIQYLIQAGFLPPLDEGSVSGVFRKFYIDIGDDQSYENDLSTYSSHLMNMKYFLNNSDNNTLVLIDEFGAGTEPQLGAAISESILAGLLETMSFGVITTHYSNLKHFAASSKGILNAAMMYDNHRMQPLFRLDIGKPGSSFAFEIARNIGLPESVLKLAETKIGEDHVKFDKHLREISRDKRYWEEKRKKIRKAEKRLDGLLEEYESRISQLEKEKKKVVREARAQAEELLGRINQKIEKTVQQIREEQAEREKTLELRKQADEFKEEVTGELLRSEREEDEKLQRVKEEHGRIRKKMRDVEPKPDKKQVEYTQSDLYPGAMVHLKEKDLYGEVLGIKGSSIMVAFGQMITTVSRTQLEMISQPEFEKITGKTKTSSSFSGFDLQERRLNFSPSIDLRGVRGDEAMSRLQSFIDEAVMLGEKNLRILHGKGNGILRQMTRDYLSAVDVVKTYKDEDIRLGGSGITLVVLDF
jgi:DNA mismatch repair protein MutS2